MTDSEQQTTEDLQAWARRPGEPGRWYARFLLFRDIGPNRSLRETIRQATKDDEKQQNSVPGAWFDAFHKWQWRERAEAWDTVMQAQEEQEARHILSLGLATVHGRVAPLAEIAGALLLSFRGRDGAIDVNRIDNKTLEQFRGVLDDIAKETGGRVKKQETAVTALPPNVYIGFNPDTDGSEK